MDTITVRKYSNRTYTYKTPHNFAFNSFNIRMKFKCYFVIIVARVIGV